MELNMCTVFLIVLLCLFSPTSAQLPSIIPSNLDGFWYDNGKWAEKGQILIEAFLDPVCPDSRDSWPHLKNVLIHYGNRVSLVTHTFPLPYHDNAFAASRALHIVNELNKSATYHLLEAFFENQEQFYGKATINMSKPKVVDRIVNFSTTVLGESVGAKIRIGFNSSTTDGATRIGFKFGCLRGVYATPFFFVNGFPFVGPGSAQNYSVWKQVLDPLIYGKQ